MSLNIEAKATSNSLDAKLPERKRIKRSWKIAAVATVLAAALATESDASPTILTFDSLHGRSDVVKVYSSVGGNNQQQEVTGSFHNGEIAIVICRTVGSLIYSSPSLGESPRATDAWYEVQSEGRTYFAAGTYGDISGPKPEECKF